MKKAATIDVEINFKDASGKELPITNCTIRFMIKTADNLPNSAALLDKSANIIDAAKGKATVKVTAAEAALLPHNKPLLAESSATYPDTSIVRTETISFVLTTNLIK
jgi:hypothetical protein